MTRGKAFEIVWPYALALAIASLYCWAWSPWHPVTTTFRDVLSAMSRGAGTVFGFLLSASALLVAVKGSWYKQRAKEAGVYRSLIRYLFRAMWLSLALMVVSITGLSYDVLWWNSHSYMISIWLSIAVAALGATIRALRIFSRLLLPELCAE
jgi:hypothetical protein